ncbi:hypothetical protein COV92_01130 [Candidatus Uhrbacteria bacterium CG11_big_fil_rev_8_21_14_0_20_41_9]|nr:MAG: hypothetical protein COV92_01130 [Candidatus Uhrbacteria bacterium CG11_big_fil_rev_8_21_14_0_20_41_9]
MNKINVSKRSRVLFLDSDRLYLRPIEMEDVHNFQRWINDPEVRRYLVTRGPISKLQEAEFLRQMMGSANHRIFVIVLKEADRAIGTMGIHNINWIDRTGTTGTMIGEVDCWNKGYAKEAKKLLLRHAFMEMNLRRIETAVIAENKASIKCQEACGYVREGLLRKKVFRTGKYLDEVVLAIMRDDWLELQRETQG